MTDRTPDGHPYDEPIQPQQFPGMKPWFCDYTGLDGGTYGIILYGSDAQQVLDDNCEALPGLTVLGELGATVYVRPEDEAALRRRYGGTHD